MDWVSLRCKITNELELVNPYNDLICDIAKDNLLSIQLKCPLLLNTYFAFHPGLLDNVVGRSEFAAFKVECFTIFDR
jgi:hypothetical protein